MRPHWGTTESLRVRKLFRDGCTSKEIVPLGLVFFLRDPVAALGGGPTFCDTMLTPNRRTSWLDFEKWRQQRTSRPGDLTIKFLFHHTTAPEYRGSRVVSHAGRCDALVL